ncbi:phospholipase D-like domain-containing protein [Ferrimonas balearica]|uniref:phospholipase D-like domain-containing protein n=1 Tax=Ferrimonas balearica TaxID=44012 RepID=UPI001F46250E|nr:phospholipase D family protein [Ferrimonas balearica]MBY6095532.1 phospholipase D family protein [Ferrimonas balearica]
MFGMGNKVSNGVMRHLGMLMLIGLAMGCASSSVSQAPRPAERDDGAPVSFSGEVYLVATAEEALARRIHAIRQARQTVDLTYFTWTYDVSGLLMLDALMLAAERGVQVRILLDDLLVFDDHWLVEIDRHPNIQIRLFNPFTQRKGGWMARSVEFAGQTARLNHRLHQKYFAVDRDWLILGGRNIGDDYFGYHKKANFFDLDVIVKGPVGEAFADNFTRLWRAPKSRPVTQVIAWQKGAQTYGSRFADYRAENAILIQRVEAAVGRLAAPVFVSATLTPLFDNPDKAEAPKAAFRHRVERFLAEADRPQRTALVSTPYMLPTGEEFEAMSGFRERGAEVTLLTNSMASNDSAFVAAYYNRYRKPLLEMGLNIYEYDSQAYHPDYQFHRQTYYHNKAFILDRTLTYIGSSNFDPRSDNLNLELGLMVESDAFAADLEHYLLTGQRGNYWQAVLTGEGKVEWHKGGQRRTSNPNTHPLHALPDWLYRRLNFKSEL